MSEGPESQWKGIFSATEERIPHTGDATRPIVLWRLTEERLAEEADSGRSIFADLQQHLRALKARRKLRSDLIISEIEEGGEAHYVIKDPLALKYFRFQENEYFVLTLLDGHHEVRDLVHAYGQTYRPIRPVTVQRFLEQVASFGLLEQGRTNIYTRIAHRLPSTLISRLARLSRLECTFPDTDRFTQWLYQKVRFAFSALAAWLWVLLALSGWGLIFSSGRRFWVDLQTVLASGWGVTGYAAAIYAGLLLVVLVHELAHALTCVHFGGHIHKMGIIFYHLSLTAYADTSDAWLFPNRWHRVWVSVAGPLSTLCFGAVAAWVWWLAPAGSTGSRLALTLVLSTLPLALANLNPFLEYDGYYVLSDLTGIPNLRQRSFEYCRQWAWHQLDKGRALAETTTRERRIFLGYGLLAGGYLVAFIALLLTWQIPYLLKQYGLVVGGGLVAIGLLLFGWQGIRASRTRWGKRGSG
jgi:putative peptide zinc metalloprotease protein